MNKLGRKLLVAGLCACMAAASLTGCGSKAGKAAVTVGDDTASLGLVNLMLRYNQAQMQSLYASFMGDNMWETYGETTKNNVVESIENMFLMEQHMSDYGVSITDEDKTKITDAAGKFIETNDEKTMKAMNATQENVERLLTLYTVQSRMYNAIIADVDTNVSDEEAAQKTVKYVLFSTAGSTDEDGNSVEMSDEDKAAKKEAAQKLLDAVKGGEDMADALTELGEDRSPVTSSYGTDNGTLNDALKEAADKLSDGEVADELIETDGGYYVLQMVTTFDEEKTNEQKDTIISQRKSDLYTTTLDGWKEDAKISTDSDLLATLGFTDTYQMKETETETSTETAAETAATEAASEAVTEAATTEAATEAATETATEAATTEVATEAATTEAATEAATTEAATETETATEK
ncbi:MAG: peptidylprolyl isomerase [Lachnospiraceae bacterium]